MTVLALALATAVGIVGGGSWRLSWLFVLAAFAAGLSHAEQFGNSASHFFGLVLLMLGVGPVILNSSAMALRAAAWRLVVKGMSILTPIFVVWYLLHLPSFGVGFFSSFMNQCMLLGPIAGMGVSIALVRALHGHSWRWGLLGVLGVMPVLASASRVSVLATGATGCFFLVRRKPVLGGLMALLFSFAVYGFVTSGGSDEAGDSLTSALASKGIDNSRADLWQARIDEFKSSPLFGIGVAMGTGSGSAVEQGGVIRVEPGSSYLAVLAMTGGFGAVAFITALGLLIYQFAQHRTTQDQDILCAIGIFLAVHGVAEGWILGFGSPLCLLFWLWLGRIGDAALQPATATARRRVSMPNKVRATILREFPG